MEDLTKVDIILKIKFQIILKVRKMTAGSHNVPHRNHILDLIDYLNTQDLGGLWSSVQISYGFQRPYSKLHLTSADSSRVVCYSQFPNFAAPENRSRWTRH